MQLEDFFEFEPPPRERIRVRDTRINLEHIVSLFQSGMTPEQIHAYFGQWPPLEKVYGAITYYLNNKETVEAYVGRVEAALRTAAEKQSQEPDVEVVRRLKAIRAERAAAKGPAA